MTGAITYRIDAGDRIVKVGGAWSDFALANGGNPDPSAAIGRLLWDVIVDEGYRELYRLIVAEVRDRRMPIHIPFRCDSDTMERHMTMTIVPGEADEVAFICRLHHSHRRNNSKAANRNAGWKSVVECESCNRVQTRHGWKPCWDAIVAGDIEIDHRPVKIQHASCHDCEGVRATA